MPQLSENDISEIRRIAQKKSVRRIAKAVDKDLDRDTLSTLISAYLVLKANGYTDNDFVRYLAMKQTKRMLRLGFEIGSAVACSFLADGEFRKLFLDFRRQMNAQKKKKAAEERRSQQEFEHERHNVAKAGPMTVTMSAPTPQTIETQRTEE